MFVCAALSFGPVRSLGESWRRLNTPNILTNARGWFGPMTLPWQIVPMYLAGLLLLVRCVGGNVTLETP